VVFHSGVIVVMSTTCKDCPKLFTQSYHKDSKLSRQSIWTPNSSASQTLGEDVNIVTTSPQSTHVSTESRTYIMHTKVGLGLTFDGISHHQLSVDMVPVPIGLSQFRPLEDMIMTTDGLQQILPMTLPTEITSHSNVRGTSSPEHKDSTTGKSIPQDPSISNHLSIIPYLPNDNIFLLSEEEFDCPSYNTLSFLDSIIGPPCHWSLIPHLLLPYPHSFIDPDKNSSRVDSHMTLSTLSTCTESALTIFHPPSVLPVVSPHISPPHNPFDSPGSSIYNLQSQKPSSSSPVSGIYGGLHPLLDPPLTNLRGRNSALGSAREHAYYDVASARQRPFLGTLRASHPFSKGVLP
jgi:hypothetical protein